MTLYIPQTNYNIIDFAQQFNARINDENFVICAHDLNKDDDVVKHASRLNKIGDKLTGYITTKNITDAPWTKNANIKAIGNNICGSSLRKWSLNSVKMETFAHGLLALTTQNRHYVKGGHESLIIAKPNNKDIELGEIAFQHNDIVAYLSPKKCNNKNYFSLGLLESRDIDDKGAMIFNILYWDESSKSMKFEHDIPIVNLMGIFYNFIDAKDITSLL